MLTRGLSTPIPNRDGSFDSRLKRLADRSNANNTSDPEVSAKIQAAIELLEQRGSMLTSQDLVTIGLPEKHHGTFVYFALAKKYPELVPNMMGNSIADGLTRLSKVRDEPVQKKLDLFMKEFEARGDDARFSHAQLGGFEAGPGGLKIKFTLPMKPRPGGEEPVASFRTGGLEFEKTRLADSNGTSWRARLDDHGETWVGTLRSTRSIHDLATSDLESLQKMLARYLPPEGADPGVTALARSNPNTAAIAELHDEISGVLTRRTKSFRELFDGLLAGGGIGRVDDKNALCRVAELVNRS